MSSSLDMEEDPELLAMRNELLCDFFKKPLSRNNSMTISAPEESSTATEEVDELTQLRLEALQAKRNNKPNDNTSLHISANSSFRRVQATHSQPQKRNLPGRFRYDRDDEEEDAEAEKSSEETTTTATEIEEEFPPYGVDDKKKSKTSHAAADEYDPTEPQLTSFSRPPAPNIYSSSPPSSTIKSYNVDEYEPTDNNDMSYTPQYFPASSSSSTTTNSITTNLPVSSSYYASSINDVENEDAYDPTSPLAYDPNSNYRLDSVDITSINEPYVPLSYDSSHPPPSYRSYDPNDYFYNNPITHPIDYRPSSLSSFYTNNTNNKPSNRYSPPLRRFNGDDYKTNEEERANSGGENDENEPNEDEEEDEEDAQNTPKKIRSVVIKPDNSSPATANNPNNSLSHTNYESSSSTSSSASSLPRDYSSKNRRPTSNSKYSPSSSSSNSAFRSSNYHRQRKRSK